MAKTRQKVFEYVEPIGARVLVRKDEPKRETKGGIALPDAAEIPTITGRIVAISAQIENDEDVPLRQYDKILFHPKNAIPVDFEADNSPFRRAGRGRCRRLSAGTEREQRRRVAGRGRVGDSRQRRASAAQKKVPDLW